MYLQNKIMKYICLSKNLNIYSLDGEKIDNSKIKNEYASIKNYLLINFSTNDTIIISIKKDYKYMLILLACIEIGLTYIPIKSFLPKNRIKQISKLSNSKQVIDDEEFKKIILYNGLANIVSFDIFPTKALYIIFTSGSTGVPKGVVIQRKACENFFHWLDEYFIHLNNKTRLLQVADFSFDISLLDIGIVLTKHVHIFFTNFDNSIFKLAYEIENLKISFISTVPNNFNMLLADGVVERINLLSLKDICIAGARYSFRLYKAMTKYFTAEKTNIYNCYGPTEATVYASVHKMKYQEEQDLINYNVSIGKPISNTVIKILDKNKNITKQGEMYIGGMQIMEKYISNNQQTKEALINIDDKIYYKTGDVSFIDDEGKYYIIGRLDDTIKRKGYRINTLDIDSYIQKIEDVLDSVSIAVPDKMIEHKIITYIISNNTDLESIKLKIKNILVDYQIPDKIKKIDSFPLNIAGKVCKKTLLSMYQASNNKKGYANEYKN